MKYLQLLVVLLLIFFVPSVVQAGEAYLNRNNVLMLPLRDTFEELGYTVSWNDGNINLEKNDQSLVFKYGRDNYLYDNKVTSFTVLPNKINSTIYVSKDFVEQVTSLTGESKELDEDQYKLVLNKDGGSLKETASHLLEGELFDPYRYTRDTVEQVPILMYHMIDDPANYSGIGHYKKYLVHPDAFKKQLRWLRETGYNPVTMQELYAHRVQGEPILENPVIITLDDGYSCAYHNALPELMRYDMVGSVFVCSGNLDGERYLSEEMLQQLSKQGIEVGSHSITHANLLEISLEEAEKEIQKSKAELEEIIETDVQFFSYPYGAYNQEIINLVQESGYLGAVTISSRDNSLENDFFQLSRVSIDHDETLEDFAEKVQGF